MIISGVGGAPDFSAPLAPKFSGKTICQDTVRNILSVLRREQGGGVGGGKPVLVVISTTGITAKRDIPLAMVPLYNLVLRTPHADKKVMEGLVFEEAACTEEERVLSDYVMIRPSLLTNGPAGKNKMRVLKGNGEGMNTAGGLACPFVGYTVCREDVGGFMFGLVKGLEGEEGREYFGSVVSISH